MRLAPKKLLRHLRRRLAKARARRRPPLVEPVRTGIIGCGVISQRYLETAAYFNLLDVVACADTCSEAAQKRARSHGIPLACTVEELLGDPSIELVINLTPPTAHFEISAAALGAGKSVYSEKPLAIARQDACALLAQAESAGLRIGCAPDTVLGGGLQTCRKLVDEGAIGIPVGAVAVCASRSPEIWHPDPAGFFQPGGGPLLDMAPYYLTALVHFMGPIRRISGIAGTSPLERIIARGPRAGEGIEVGTPTLVMALLEFANGAYGNLTVTYDFAGASGRGIQLYGTEGTLQTPDPNGFDGPVRLFRRDTVAWRTIPLTHGYTMNFRGLGAADMAFAMRTGRPHRANAQIAYHVVDVMQAILETAETGASRDIESSCERPAPMPPGLEPGALGP